MSERKRNGVDAEAARSTDRPPEPARAAVPRESYTGLVLLALVVGLGVMAYVYVYANR